EPGVDVRHGRADARAAVVLVGLQPERAEVAEHDVGHRPFLARRAWQGGQLEEQGQRLALDFHAADPKDGRAQATSSPARDRARSSAAATKPRKSGAGRVGRDLNSGWNWLATNQGCSGSSTISTSRPSSNVPQTTSPPSISCSRYRLFTSYRWRCRSKMTASP